MAYYSEIKLYKEDLIVQTLKDRSHLKLVNVLLIVITIIQIIIGTQVRQQIDVLSLTLGFDGRAQWIENLDYYFKIHRTFSILVFLIHVYFFYRMYKATSAVVLKWANIALIGLVGVEMVGGFIMGNFNIPAFVQPIHMLAATVLLGVQFFILFVFNLNKNQILLR